jgi:hypothetical protein
MYEVFEAVLPEGGLPALQLACALAPVAETRVLASFRSWRAALRAVARLESQGHAAREGAGYALGIRRALAARVNGHA